MRLVYLLLAAGLSMPGALIQGVVVERATQRALARSRVRLLAPMAGGGLRTVAEVAAGRNGTFLFPSLADGDYLVTAVRPGYLEGRYGQTRATGPGKLIRVKGDESAYAELRLARLGAVTGRIYDENYVGLADVTVIAYAARLPLRIEGSAKSDDRGVFRIGRLRPGKYWVRTAPHELEDGSSLLPVFFPLSHGVTDARAVIVDADRDETDVDIQPAPGRLFSVEGQLQNCPPDAKSGKVVLSSDTGSKEMVVGCEMPFQFTGLSPNKYELYAEPLNSKYNWAAYMEQAIERSTKIDMVMAGFPRVRITVNGAQGSDLERGGKSINVRRKRLDAAAALRPISDPLGPGYWEVFVTPPDGSYFGAVTTSSGRFRGARLTPADIAPEIRLDPESYVSVDVRIGGNAAVVEGMVKEGGEPVVAAPVFLYPLEDDVRRRMHGVRTVQTGPKGEFRMGSVVPGRYLILSTWELDEITETALNHARAQTLVLTEGQRETVSLTLWGAAQ